MHQWDLQEHAKNYESGPQCISHHQDRAYLCPYSPVSDPEYRPKQQDPSRSLHISTPRWWVELLFGNSTSIRRSTEQHIQRPATMIHWLRYTTLGGGPTNLTTIVMFGGLIGAFVGTTGAGVGTTGAGVGSTGALVGSTEAEVGSIGAGVGRTGADVGGTGAGVTMFTSAPSQADTLRPESSPYPLTHAPTSFSSAT